MAWVAAAALAFVTAVFLVANAWRRPGLAGLSWAGSLIVAALVSFLLQPEADSFTVIIRILVTVMVIVWGMLTVSRVLAAAGRQKADRSGRTLAVYARDYLAQTALAVVVAAPVLLINLSAYDLAAAPAVAATVIGFAIWLIGLAMEMAAQGRLPGFVPAGAARRGKQIFGGLLGRLGQRPEALGLSIEWWGLFVMGLGLPMGWLGIVSPLILMLLGLALHEAKPARKAA